MFQNNLSTMSSKHDSVSMLSGVVIGTDGSVLGKLPKTRTFGKGYLMECVCQRNKNKYTNIQTFKFNTAVSKRKTTCIGDGRRLMQMI